MSMNDIVRDNQMDDDEENSMNNGDGDNAMVNNTKENGVSTWMVYAMVVLLVLLMAVLAFVTYKLWMCSRSVTPVSVDLGLDDPELYIDAVPLEFM